MDHREVGVLGVERERRLEIAHRERDVREERGDLGTAGRFDGHVEPSYFRPRMNGWANEFGGRTRLANTDMATIVTTNGSDDSRSPLTS